MNGKTTSIFAFLLLMTPIGLSDELDAKVTVSSKAGSLKKLVEEASRQSGVVLTVPAFLGSEPIIASIREAKLRDVMDRIALCVGGEWQKVENRYQLAYTSKHLNEDKRQVEAATAQAIALQQAALRKSLAEQGEYNQVRARQEAENEAANQGLFQELRNGTNQRINFKQVVSPGLHLLQRMVSRLDPQQLASLPPSRRVVFSTLPTAMQRPMPPQFLPDIQSFAAIHEMYLKERAAVPRPPENSEGFVIDQTVSRPFNGGLDRALLVIHRFSNDQFTLTLLIADKSGKFVSQASHMLNLRNQIGESKPPVEPQPDTSSPFEVSQDAKAQASLLQYVPPASPGSIEVVGSRSRFSRRVGISITSNAPPTGPAEIAKPAITAEWKKRLLAPHQFEPLSYAASELILLAFGEKNNVIALVPDEFAVQCVAVAQQPCTTQRLANQLRESWNCDVSETPGWTIIRPKDRIAARTSRINRIAASSLLKSIDSQARLALDPLADYLQTQNGKYSNGNFLDRYCGLLKSESRTRFIKGAQTDFEITKLWGSLGQAQRISLQQGGKVQCRLLSPAQKELVDNLVFHSLGGPEMEWRSESGPVNRNVNRISTDSGFMMGAIPDDLASERTQHLAGGVPADAFLEIKLETEPAVLASAAASEDGRVMNAIELGVLRSMASSEMPVLRDPQIAPTLDRFRFGEKSTITLMIQLTEAASISGSISDFALPPGAPLVSYGELPDAFRKQVEKYESSMKLKASPPPPPLRLRR